jgi:purine-binding chemotaxis protein CheW
MIKPSERTEAAAEGTGGTEVLLVTAGQCTCAIPVSNVSETLRPLPIDAVAGAPEFIMGLSVIRGVPLPVIDLARLLERAETSTSSSRFVTVRVSERRVALAVGAVIGVRSLAAIRLLELPPLLRSARADFIERLGTIDADLVLVLRGSRLVADDVTNLA